MTQLIQQEPKKWWQPAGFKELGAAFLSLALVILLFYSLGKVFGLLSTMPQTIKVGEAFQVVDVYDRAKNLLLILFPLFSAVISFWLGVAVEGRRADANGFQAANESAKRETAEKREAAVRQEAEHVLGTLKGGLMAMSTVDVASPPNLESLEYEFVKQEKAVEEMLNAVIAAEAALHRQ